MPQTFTTKQGQTVDLACSAHYGRTKDVTEIVLDANPDLSSLGDFLPMGTKILMPDVDTKAVAPKLVGLWE